MTDNHVFAGNDVKAVRPYLVGKYLEVFDKNVLASPRADVPVVVADNGHTVYLDVFAFQKVDVGCASELACLRGNDTVAENADVVDLGCAYLNLYHRALIDEDNGVGFGVDNTCFIIRVGLEVNEILPVVDLLFYLFLTEEEKRPLQIAVYLKTVIVGAGQKKADRVVFKREFLCSACGAERNGIYPFGNLDIYCGNVV